MQVSDPEKTQEPTTVNKSEKPGLFNWAKSKVFGSSKPKGETGGMARPMVGTFNNDSIQVNDFRLFFQTILISLNVSI